MSDFKVQHSKKIFNQFTDTTPMRIVKVDLASISKKKDHSFERQWAQVINPESMEISAGRRFLSTAVTERESSSKVSDQPSKQPRSLSAVPRNLCPCSVEDHLRCRKSVSGDDERVLNHGVGEISWWRGLRSERFVGGSVLLWDLCPDKVSQCWSAGWNAKRSIWVDNLLRSFKWSAHFLSIPVWSVEVIQRGSFSTEVQENIPSVEMKMVERKEWSKESVTEGNSLDRNWIWSNQYC